MRAHIYISYMRFPVEIVTPFFKWFSTRHAPDLYECGFRSCTCFQNIENDTEVIDLYTIDDMSVFADDRYLALDRDVNKGRFMGRMQDHGVVVYNAVSADDESPTNLDGQYLVWLRQAHVTSEELQESINQIRNDALRAGARVARGQPGPMHPRAKSAKYEGGAIFISTDTREGLLEICSSVAATNIDGHWSVSRWARIYPSAHEWLDASGRPDNL